MAAKTPSGLTERQQVNDIVLQGDTWGSIMASVQVDSIGKHVEEANIGYMYKNKLPISFLGLVDDVIGVSEAGHKAVQMNEIINTKSAEKSLQFGISKCKSMFVGKVRQEFLDNELEIDKWSLEYQDNSNTGDEDIIETFQGKVPIGKTKDQKYLGFVISSCGDNMANITALKNKSIGTIKKINNKLEALNLLDYYFECSIIFTNVMLRPSLLYASECYYNLTEKQIRHIERIEESYLRNILKTGRGCPIVQIYQELGQVPARFELQRLRLLFLKNILEQDINSMSYKFLYLQVEHPTRGDWVSTCLDDLKQLGITASLEDIKKMSKRRFNRILIEKTRQNASNYLEKKKGIKGKEIIYTKIEMADYLLPNSKLSINEKQRLFAIRNQMVDIPNHFSSENKKYLCICGEEENLPHIYVCERLNETEIEKLPYEKIYTGNVEEQRKILEKMENNLQVREKNINEKETMNEKETKNEKETENRKKRKKPKPPCDPLVDPLYCKKFGFG